MPKNIGGRLNVRNLETKNKDKEIISLKDLSKKEKNKNPIIILPIKDIEYTTLFNNYDYKSSDKDINIPLKIKLKDIDKKFDIIENLDDKKTQVSLEDVLKTYYLNHPGQIFIYNEDDEKYEPINIDMFKKIQKDIDDGEYNEKDYNFDTFSKDLLDFISLDKDNKDLLNEIGYTNLPLSIFGEKDLGVIVNRINTNNTIIGIPSEIAFGIYIDTNI